MISKKVMAALLISATINSGMLWPVLAEEKDNHDTALDEIVVSGDKIDESGYGRLAVPESSKAATETFSRADIEAMHPKDVFEVIERGLGTMGTRTGLKGFVNPRTRGGDGMGVIIDGVYFTWTESARILQSIPVGLIDSVTIVRDGTIMTMGPLATIGTMSGTTGASNQGFLIINTRKSYGREDEIKISYGTYNTQNFSIIHGDKLKDDSYLTLAYAKAKSDGKDDWHNASDLDTYFFKTGHEGKNLITDLTLLANQGTREPQVGINPDGTYSTNTMRYDPIKTFMLAFNAVRPWDEHRSTLLNFGFSSVRSTLFPDGSSSSSPIIENEYLRELNLLHTISHGGNTLKFGGQAIWWHSPTGVVNVAGYERQEELFGYYLFDEKRVNDKLTIDGGARIDKKHIIKGIGKYLGTTRDTMGDQWDNDATSFSLGANYKLDPVYKLSTRFSYSNQPTPSFLLTVDNKSLDSEVRYKYEMGITADYNKRLNASLTAFYYDISNARIIDHVYHPASLPASNKTQDQNVYDAHDLARQGLEFALNGRLSSTVGYKLGYSCFTSSNAADSSINPHNTCSLMLNYKKKDIDANITLLHVGSYLSSATNGKPLGDFTTIDANISKMLDADTRLTFYARNVADNRYAIGTNTAYYYDTGRACGLELTKKF